MKKFLSVLACFMLVLCGGVLLASCGASADVKLSTSKIGTVSFANGSVKLVEDEKSTETAVTYKVTGKAHEFSAEQLKAAGYDAAATAEAKKPCYVNIAFKWSKGVTISFNSKSYSYDNEQNKKDHDNNGYFNVVKLVKSDNKATKFEVTVKTDLEGTENDKTVVYTFDFSELTNFAA